METLKVINKSLNSENLQKLAQENPTTEALLMSLALRLRNTAETHIQRYRYVLMREGIKVVDEDYRNAWKKLQDLGAGVIVFGRKGKADRFKWHYALIDIGNMAFADKSVIELKRKEVESQPEQQAQAEAANENPAQVEEFSPSANSPRPLKKRKASPRVKTDSGKEVHIANKTLYVPIRKNQGVEIIIPSDLSSEEADTLAAALKRMAKSA